MYRQGGIGAGDADGDRHDDGVRGSAYLLGNSNPMGQSNVAVAVLT
ncbi:MAG: hypothetical protein ACLRXQ_09015 [Phascolarctobacterium faecium]